MSLKDIININISRQTTAVTQLGFGVMMILGMSKVFANRIRFYTAADQLLDDGFESTDDEYIAALAAFGQNPQVVQVAIGRIQVENAGISIDTVVDNTDYTVTVNGIDYTHDSGAAASANSIAAALVALIDVNPDVDATDDVDGTFVIAPLVATTAFSVVVVGSNLSVEKSAYSTTETVADSLNAVDDENPDWYALAMTSHVSADVQAAAAVIETQRRIFLTSSSDVNILDAVDITDIAYILKNSAYARTAVLYHTAADTTFPECAWLGKQLPTNPGSSTWMFKTLAGVAAVTLTATQALNALNKNASTYQAIGGVNITREGKTASGEFIDVIRFVDWLHARMTERIYSRLVNLPKVPFTDPGLAAIENEIRAQLDAGIEVGGLAADPVPTVTVPKVSSISANDKALRNATGITFQAVLAGAVHKLTINGVVTV